MKKQGVANASTVEMVCGAIATLEIVEMYPQDTYLPSFLVSADKEMRFILIELQV